MRICGLICIISLCLFGLITSADTFGTSDIPSFTWMTLPTTMPFSGGGFITAFDTNTGLVWILGGTNGINGKDAIYQWNITSDNFIYMGALSHPTYNYGQSWVTKDSIIYWVDYYNTKSIHSFDITSAVEVANDLNASFPHRASDSCVTTDYDKYLIIVGGFAPYKQETQIYNFETKEWLSNMPQLNIGRYQHTCHVYGSYVYAIAGFTGDLSNKTQTKTLERLNLETMNNWFMTMPLTHARFSHRSVLINDMIVVTGGSADEYVLKSVEIISMADDYINSVSYSYYNDLNIGVYRHGIISDSMNNVIIFGGRKAPTEESYINKIQSSDETDDEIDETNDYPNYEEDDTDDGQAKDEEDDTLYVIAVGVLIFCAVVFGIFCSYKYCCRKEGDAQLQTQLNTTDTEAVSAPSAWVVDLVDEALVSQDLFSEENL